jgi:putative sigma-54 modulation protein
MSNKNQQTQEYDVIVSGRHVEVTAAMKDYAIEKLAKIERYHTRISDVVVTMDIQKKQHIVDMVIKANRFRVKSHAVCDNMYASIDKAVGKLEKQLRRYKTRLNDHHAKGRAEIDLRVNVFERQDDTQAINDEIEEQNNHDAGFSLQPHKVVSHETRPMKVLTVDEAIMKMDLSGEAFLLYKSEEDQNIKVIYRRNDGNYGVMEPQ